jgi:O-methyltransferase
MDTLYAARWPVSGPEDCHFYHTMDIPGFGLIRGSWDLTASIDDLLGRVSFAGTRVLEIGPASGYITFEMERRGASVVSIEVPDDPGWDFVPYPPAVLDPVYASRREVMRRLKNSYWFAHSAHRSQAQICYTDVYRLPDEIGEFDVAIMANVLLHCHSPAQIIRQCAARAKTLIISEMLYSELEGSAVCRLAPTIENSRWDTWWNFSTAFFVQYLQVLGFRRFERFDFTAVHKEVRPYPFFTIVASRH